MKGLRPRLVFNSLLDDDDVSFVPVPSNVVLPEFILCDLS